MRTDETLVGQIDAAAHAVSRGELPKLFLNQRIETMEHFIAPSLWKSCMGPSPQLKGRRCWGGLDLGATRDSLRDQCNTKAAGLPFFVKQMTTGWIPPDLQFRELPRWQR